LVINMSGMKLPMRIPGEVRSWSIEDPIGQPEEIYIAVREQIEMLVMLLILELRRNAARQNGAQPAEPAENKNAAPGHRTGPKPR
jgi:hypothetical protein